MTATATRARRAEPGDAQHDFGTAAARSRSRRGRPAAPQHRPADRPASKPELATSAQEFAAVHASRIEPARAQRDFGTVAAARARSRRGRPAAPQHRPGGRPASKPELPAVRTEALTLEPAA